MDKKLIFLDADGTLTLPDGRVSPKVQEAIHQVQKMDMKSFYVQEEVMQELDHFFQLVSMVLSVVRVDILRCMVKKSLNHV